MQRATGEGARQVKSQVRLLICDHFKTRWETVSSRVHGQAAALASGQIVNLSNSALSPRFTYSGVRSLSDARKSS